MNPLIRNGREIVVSSMQDLLACKPKLLEIKATSEKPCEYCLARQRSIVVPEGMTVGDVISESQLPPYHPNCKCIIRLVFSFGSMDINPNKFPAGSTLQLPPKTGTLEEWEEIKRGLDKIYDDYQETLRSGLVDNPLTVIDSAAKILKLKPPFDAKSCNQRAQELAEMFNDYLTSHSVSFVTVLYSTGVGHAWVVVAARYLNDDWRIVVERRKYDAWIISLQPKSTMHWE